MVSDGSKMLIPMNILDTCLHKVVTSHLLLPWRVEKHSMSSDHRARDAFLSSFIRQLLQTEKHYLLFS